MHRAIAAFLAVAFCAPPAPAQTAGMPGHLFALADALSAARASSPMLEAFSAGLRAARAARSVAGLRPNPTASLETENIAGSGNYRGTRSAETTASIAFPVELGGKRSARIAVADSQATRAEIDQAIAAAELRLRVTQAYSEAVAAEERLQIAQNQVQLANAGLNAAITRVRAGVASPLERQRADVQRVNATLAADAAGRSAATARENLARLIGRPVAGTLDIAWFRRVGAYGPLQPEGADRSLTLAASAADTETAAAQVRLASSQRVPDVTLSAGARRLAATNDTAAVLSVSVPLPLFNNGNAALSQARAERDRAEALQRAAVRETAQAIATARLEADNAVAAARAATGPALLAAEEAARIARIGYREGKFGQLDLIDAERALAATRAAAIDALAAYHDARARLDRLTATFDGIAR